MCLSPIFFRLTLVVPFLNNTRTLLFRFSTTVFNPITSGFLTEQGLKQLLPVLQILLAAHFLVHRNRDLKRRRFPAAQSEMIENKFNHITQDLSQLG